MKSLLTAAILSLLAIGPSFGQSPPLDSAKTFVASNRLREAIPILERIILTNPTRAAHNYFLGLCLVREGIRIQEAVQYLEKAAAIYGATDVNPGMGEPEMVHFYLTIGYSRLRECDKALKCYYELVEVYSGTDPFYPNEAMKWVVLCNEPQRMAQEMHVGQTTTTLRTSVRDRLVSVQNPTNRKDSVVTRPVEFSTQSVLYGVQVGALVKPMYTVHFPDLKNIGVYVDENGIFRYVIGNLTYRTQAEKLLQQVRTAGYPDAFIVDINNSERYRDEVVLLNEIGIQKQLTGTVEFMVQIGAFADALPEQLASLYMRIDGLREVRTGDLTLLMVGTFSNYEEAHTEKEKLIESGFKDAFITAFNQKERIPVNLALKYLEVNSPSQKDSIDIQKRK
jgi:tetratricopeptide (TPR) repeat protein